MIVILLGPPGAGKGTQAEMLIDRYKLTHVSTGDILRSSIKRGTELGNKAKEYMDRGELVSDDIIVGIVEERLQEPDCESGALLDGFPRTVVQARSLEKVLERLGRSIDAVIYIELDEEEVISRLTGRRICRECGASYHQKFNPPQVRNVCDQCGGELYQREDDSDQTVRQRISVYKEQTEPLIDYYEKNGKLRKVDGYQEIKDVFNQICQILDSSS